MAEEMTMERKIARLRLVADGLRLIHEFESAQYLEEYAGHLAKNVPTHVAEWAVSHGLTFFDAPAELDGKRVALVVVE
jgi:hypothetical protein